MQLANREALDVQILKTTFDNLEPANAHRTDSECTDRQSSNGAGSKRESANGDSAQGWSGLRNRMGHASLDAIQRTLQSPPALNLRAVAKREVDEGLLFELMGLGRPGSGAGGGRTRHLEQRAVARK